MESAEALAQLPQPGALILDLDGTLVDTVPTRIEAWMRTFTEVRIPAEWGHVARLIGADGRRLAREVAGIAGRELDEDRAEAIDRRAGEVYGQLNSDPRPLPGARELLETLIASGLPWAIATSSRQAQVARSVESLGLPDLPPIVDGSQVRQAKPSPELLLIASERLGVPSMRCWCVGDATWDMRAARAATMVPVGVVTGAVSGAELTRAGAAAVLSSLESLTAELRRRAGSA
ncbi:HAD family hydrolase [soil metagenome]